MCAIIGKEEKKKKKTIRRRTACFIQSLCVVQCYNCTHAFVYIRQNYPTKPVFFFVLYINNYIADVGRDSTQYIDFSYAFLVVVVVAEHVAT